ncbi:MAG: sulfatase [Akkermansia sp.]
MILGFSRHLLFRTLSTLGALGLCSLLATPSQAASTNTPPSNRPNILFIISDDHAVQALGTCKNDSPIKLPNFHKLAQQGMVFDRSFCTNSLCGPSRACILTGRHSHKNGYLFNGQHPFDGSQPTYPQMLQKSGYQTAIFGKWHLDSNPTGFDTWNIVPNQGDYYNPNFIIPNPQGKGTHQERVAGYATDIITDKAISWLDQRDKEKPFLLVVSNKAPHRAWSPPTRLLGKIDISHLTPPANFHDDYANRPEFLKKNQQTIAKHMAIYSDLKVIKDQVPENIRKDIVSPGYGWDFGELKRMTPEEKKAWIAYYSKRTADLVDGMKSGRLKDPKAFAEWKWRAYMEDYLACIKAVDENVGRVMEYLKKNNLDKNTLVVYVGDQGFYLGEHGMYDKRWIFDESLRMPLIMRWQGKITPGVRSNTIVQNIDYAPTFCTIAGANTPENMKTFQGLNLTPLFKTGKTPENWRDAVYYCFYENPGEHNAPRHDGIRTSRYTLSYIWTSDEWMLFDLKKDPSQMKNVYADPQYKDIVKKLKTRYQELRQQYKVPENCPGKTGTPIPKLAPSWDC